MQSVAELQLVGQNGMVVFRKKLQLESGNQIYTVAFPNGVIPGRYFVRLVSQDGVLGTANAVAI